MKFKNKKRTIKISVIIGIIVLLIAITSISSLFRRSINAVCADDISAMQYETTYQTYLDKNHFSGKMAKSHITIDLNTFESSETLSVIRGTKGVIMQGEGSITWTFNVVEAGFYNLNVGYYSMPGTSSDIQRKIYIDSQIPYKSLSKIVLKRWWQDEDIIKKGNNEIRPDSSEYFTESSIYIEDSDRRTKEPLIFYLKKGSHTLTFETIKEPLEITSLVFEASPNCPEYEDYISAKRKKAKDYDGKNLIYEAERSTGAVKSIIKSSTAITIQKNHSDETVNPYHPFFNRYNVIGGSSWQNSGDCIEWEIEVPQDGLYNLTFRGRQNTNRGVTSYRRLRINNVVPCKQANAVGFNYSSRINNYTLSLADGSEMLVYLKRGINTISLENVLGPFGSIVSQVEESVKNLNEAYLAVIQLTGHAPDKYIDYEIEKKVPQFKEVMQNESERLESIVNSIVLITGEKGEQTALLEKMSIQAQGLAQKPEHAVEELAQLKNNISAVGTWLSRISQMPLELDSLILSAPGSKLPRTRKNIALRACYSVERFFASFFFSTNAVAQDSNGSRKNAKVLKVWVASYGKEQAQIIQNLIDDSFTSDTGIAVKLQLIPADVVLRAALAGNGPDVVIGLSQGTLQDFAMRKAAVNIKNMDDYIPTIAKFPKSTIDAASYNGGVYGIPEQCNFMMLFFRKDIFEKLGLDVPKTWQEFIEMIPVLQQNNYNAFVPNAYINDGSSNLNYYLSRVIQNGGDIYSGYGENYGESSALYSDEAMNAFKDYLDLYTNYGLDVQMDFTNRFRVGEVPVGITNYTAFNQLEIFAPEIKGEWGFAPVPGTLKSDGTIDNTVVVDTVQSVIMSQSKNKNEAWEFLKWWGSTKTQLSYCVAVESIMGTAARIPSANPEVLRQLPWSYSEYNSISSQLASSCGIPAVPGYYMTNRMVSYSFSDVVSKISNPKEVLYLNITSINKELNNKRKELK